jgi:hypothetical protein
LLSAVIRRRISLFLHAKFPGIVDSIVLYNEPPCFCRRISARRIKKQWWSANRANRISSARARIDERARAAARAEWRGRNGWSVLAKLEGEFASRPDIYTGTARVKYSW